jgi:hypothetical protein
MVFYSFQKNIQYTLFVAAVLFSVGKPFLWVMMLPVRTIREADYAKY